MNNPCAASSSTVSNSRSFARWGSTPQRKNILEISCGFGVSHGSASEPPPEELRRYQPDAGPDQLAGRVDFQKYDVSVVEHDPSLSASRQRRDSGGSSSASSTTSPAGRASSEIRRVLRTDRTASKSRASSDQAVNIVRVGRSPRTRQFGLSMLELELEHAGFDLETQSATFFGAPRLSPVRDGSAQLVRSTSSSMERAPLPSAAITRPFHDRTQLQIATTERHHDEPEPWNYRPALLAIDTTAAGKASGGVDPEPSMRHMLEESRSRRAFPFHWVRE